jgi:hypothetical protein
VRRAYPFVAIYQALAFSTTLCDKSRFTPTIRDQGAVSGETVPRKSAPMVSPPRHSDGGESALAVTGCFSRLAAKACPPIPHFSSNGRFVSISQAIRQVFVRA